MPRTRAWPSVLALCLFAAATGLTGITWGLPSLAADPYLFGDRTPWTGQEIIALAGQFTSDANTGSDVDRNPLDRRTTLVLNATDAERAEIVRRYRLYTYQPDEFITLRSLAGMKPGQLQLDPKVYQYGGLWIYPVGAMLKLAQLTGYATLTPDLAHYLDHPDGFGRLYVVARLYSALWLVVGAAVVWWLGRRFGGPLAGTLAGLVFVAMPVVVSMSHEAKPHLGGAVLMLAAIAAAVRYVDGGRRRWLFACGALCGAAFGMVLSSLPIFAVVPLAALYRRATWGRWFGDVALALLVGAGLYAITNPYVWINAVRNPAVLQSNLGTSTAMYAVGRWYDGVANAASLIVEGASPPAAALGLAAAVAWGVRRPRGTGWLLAVPALLVATQAAAVGAGKPGEFGRFMILTDVALGVAAAVAVARLRSARPRVAAGIALTALVAVYGGAYLAALVADTRPTNTRLLAAKSLAQLRSPTTDAIQLYAEPAPYATPPLDLWRWTLLLAPPGTDVPLPEADVTLRAVDVPPDGTRWPPTRITWADKPFDVRVGPR
ncbi:MAG TPA: glycosyltransferase family 39 protein [Tepidisphaeraceae bacterium]|nr:glycosyltransferase family 39 protein [Tepidisphaeraceae bacterium]